jgi:hypothetical protein
MQRHRVETEIQLQCIRNLAAGSGGFSAPRPDIFTPSHEKDPVPIVQESVLAWGPVWMDAEYFTNTRIRSLNRPDLSELLCWSYV